MRVTSTSYYNNIYGENNKLNSQLFDVNKQIASGKKIQYAHEDPGVFIDTLRLDDEITTLTQTKNSTDSAYKLSAQTDTTIGDIVKALETMKVKLINASTDSQSDASLQAIAKEMRGLKNHLLTLANTSIGGQFLFSGTATTQKPIDDNGLYHGNDKNLEAFLGSGLKQKYNISGSQLFLGNESNVNRTITTNVPQFNLSEEYPDIMKDPLLSRDSGVPTYISPSSSIRELMGDNNTDPNDDPLRKAHFYIQGTKSDGETFKKQVSLNSTDTVNTLVQNIKDIYGSSSVDVNINQHGQIEISDKLKGSSKLDFHMVGAVDFNTAGADDADVTNIDDLQAGSTNFETATSNTSPGLFVKEFTKSGFASDNSANTIEGINYDRTKFEQNGKILTSNISQIVKSDNSFAVASTKLLDVAGGNTLDGEQLIINGNTTYDTPFTAQIDLSAESTFSLDGGVTNYSIFNTAIPRVPVPADSMTYQQLLDVINMSITSTLPATTNTPADYDLAIDSANDISEVTLSASGKITFQDKLNPTTKALLSIYDNSSSDYTGANAINGTTGSVLNFNANNALTIRDPKKDFFAQVDEMIRSVEEGKTRSDGSDNLDPRNIGMQNSIQVIDDLTDHVSRLQAESGSYSQVLQSSSDRSSLLIINSKMLQSEIIDTDIAEATLRMQQLTLNYQAMLSTISRVSKLSLVNYL